MELKVRLKDGNWAFIINITREIIEVIKECGPVEGEFILEAHEKESKEFFDVDVRDIEEVLIET